jgi:hypothetical protein
VHLLVKILDPKPGDTVAARPAAPAGCKSRRSVPSGRPGETPARCGCTARRWSPGPAVVGVFGQRGGRG